MQTRAIIQTPQPCVYMSTLCEHFAEAHALDVQRITPRAGRVTLPGGGACLLLAQDNRLVMELLAPEENAAALVDFLARHITCLPEGRALRVTWQAPNGDAI